MATQAQSRNPLPPLRRLAPFPLGVEITTAQVDDPVAVELVSANFNQITPGLELKMERILNGDGTFNFGPGDRMLDFAEARGLKVHGHNLIWYIYRPEPFTRIADDPRRFAQAYRNYVAAVVTHYRGRLRGWDVVNEPVAEDGDGYRQCLWRERLGMDYINRALHYAREADPTAVLFVNDYNLESRPKKLDSFLRLIETLLNQGAPITGLGTQLHMRWDQPLSGVENMMRELSAFGLPIHVSELDVSTHANRLNFTPLEERLRVQAALVAGTARAYRRLPRAQQYALTFWDLRDKDSWLRLPQYGGDASEAPTLFDDQGRPKLAAKALAQALTGR
jgi:endo-1,4-beta-xylanase